MKILLCQLDIAWENRDENFRRMDALLSRVTVPKESLLVLPEMFATGFSMNLDLIAERTPSAIDGYLAGLARRTGSCVIGGTVTRGPDGRGRNQAVIFSENGQEVARYSKVHPFSLGGETQHITPGDRIITIDWHGLRVSPFVCYDLRFPELFRAAACQGAELLVNIANWPVTRVQHWITLLQARAIENQAYVVGVNRAGKDPTYTYPGRSMVINPQGEIVADAGADEAVVLVEIDPVVVRNWRRDFPALRDMRPDARV